MPAIVNGSQYMQAVLYTGTGATLTISGLNFQPDFVWIKSRSAATDHKLTDSVRGATKALVSNSTAAETTDSTGITAFNSDGFTLGASSTYNNSGATYVAWCWKAGGTAVTNNAGTVTAQVSANATAGFSVVTANYFAGTMGHGLGVAPSMIIAKQRSAVNGWYVYHVNSNAGSGANNTSLFLQNTDASTNIGTNLWNVTSTTFGSNQSLSGTGVYYCFAAIAGYSAFGSYTGNGSSDGPFGFTNFRPRFVLVKRTDTAGNSWRILDSSRSPYNLANAALYPDASIAEDTSGPQTDFLSNGFKVRSTSAGDNANGSTYIYAAFAENPFQNSLAR